MNAKLAMAVIALVVVVAVGVVAIDSAPRRAALPDPALGAQVYAENCAACHGANLEGQPNWRERNAQGRLPAPPHDATGHTWHHDDATLFGITKLGTARFTGLPIESDMPAFEGALSDHEIRSVIAFIKRSWPERIRRQQEAINQRAGNQ